MSNEDDEKTEQLDLGKFRDLHTENHATIKMGAVGASEDTVNRPVPHELLNRATPKTDKMKAIAEIPTSFLESMPEPKLTPRSPQRPQTDLDATVEMAKFSPGRKEPETEVIFSGTIDESGRIQLPASYLTDPRIRPGRKMKILIEFID